MIRLGGRIAGRRITFRSSVDRPGRDFQTGNDSGVLSPRSFRAPDRDAGVLRRPLPVQGNPTPATAPSSRRLTDEPGLPSSVSYSAGGALPGFPTPLDTGLPPSRIRRLTQAKDRGAVAPGTGVGVTGGLGFNARGSNGSLPTIPHIRIPRTPITVTAFRRTIDTTSSIPSRGIGAPVR